MSHDSHEHELHTQKHSDTMSVMITHYVLYSLMGICVLIGFRLAILMISSYYSSYIQTNVSNEMKHHSQKTLSIHEVQVSRSQHNSHYSRSSSTSITGVGLSNLPRYFKNVLFGMTIFLILQLLSSVPIIVCYELKYHYEWFNIMYSSFYALVRFTLLLLFIGRLYFTFKDTIFKISKVTFIIVITVGSITVLLFGIGTLLFSIHYHNKLHVGHDIDSHESPINYENDRPRENNNTVAIITGIYYIIDISLHIIVVLMFIKRIKIVIKNVDIKIKKLYTLIQKYAFLLIITVTVTLILVSLTYIKYAFINKYPFELLISSHIFLSIDSIINTHCAYYSMGFTKSKYDKYCKSCQICCLNSICLSNPFNNTIWNEYKT